ncbi:MAG TPA: YceH family protein [Acidimicrobiales bacterium]|nr:YceH family protein [Acidimicrobiales bacterium]
MVELSPVQQRVVGALAEKDMATPDNYPLSMNALLAACNQTTNRDPVVSFTEETVDNALANLRSSGIARVVYSKGMRVDKYRHVLHEVLGLDRAELAVVTVMLLRGPQTGAELRARTERLHPFADQAAVDATLEGLARREPALAVLHARQPGQKEPRWMHCLGADTLPREPASPEPEPTVAPAPAPAPAPVPDDRIAALEARVAAIEARLGGETSTGQMP